MKKYRVFVRGENFVIIFEGVQRKLGFFTTRFVEAEDVEKAEFAVMDMLRADSSLSGQALNGPANSPMMYVDEIEELASFDGYPVPGTGFTFFEQTSDTENDSNSSETDRHRSLWRRVRALFSSDRS